MTMMIDRAMRRWGFLAAAVLAAMALGAAHARADGTVSGKTAAAASITEQSPLGTWPMDPLNDTLLTATIMRGKRHRMLFIQASLDYNGTDGSLIGILPTVNGWGVEPFSSAVAYCTNQLCDTAAGSWWLDLDAAEAAHPGVFVGQPLLVRLLGGEISSSADTNGLWDASLTVQMSRK
jgi:hypothetical protein